MASSKDVVGHIIYDGGPGRPVFRVYSEDKSTFKDYEINVEELGPIQIQTGYYDLDEETGLTWKGKKMLQRKEESV